MRIQPGKEKSNGHCTGYTLFLATPSLTIKTNAVSFNSIGWHWTTSLPVKLFKVPEKILKKVLARGPKEVLKTVKVCSARSCQLLVGRARTVPAPQAKSRAVFKEKVWPSNLHSLRWVHPNPTTGEGHTGQPSQRGTGGLGATPTLTANPTQPGQPRGAYSTAGPAEPGWKARRQARRLPRAPGAVLRGSGPPPGVPAPFSSSSPPPFSAPAGSPLRPGARSAVPAASACTGRRRRPRWRRAGPAGAARRKPGCDPARTTRSAAAKACEGAGPAALGGAAAAEART